jgi:glutamate-1-semialdehyde 2,1-aminomutase
MQLVRSLLDSDQKLVREQIDSFVPAEVFDAHGHFFHSRHFAAGKRPVFLEEDRAYGRAEWREALGRWLPGRRLEGLFFGFPSAGNDRVGENEFVAREVAKFGVESPSRGLVLAAPEDDPGRVRELMREKGLIGVKPYRLYAPVADTAQARIEEFVPEWMWQVCDEIEGVLMLHIVRSEGIADEDNLAALERLCGEYPRCRLVLAHVARSFNYRNARAALHRIVRWDNVVVDTSAVSEMEAMRCALETLGPRRVLFGADYMVSELRAKCFTMGNGFSWLYADASDLPAKALTQFENFTLLGIESVLCLREAFEACGFNEQDRRDVFWNNGLRLVGAHLPEKLRVVERTGVELWAQAKERVSCGTGLLSKRAHLFDERTWPSYFSRCKGADVWDLEGRRYTDFTGGVGAILLGHADGAVNAAVHRRVTLGSYCTLASPDEVELAELLLELHPWAQRVRYARGGGEALSMAVRIARAATGRSGVAFCGYHGWNDWYLAANLADDAALDGHLLPGLQPLGVPRELAGTAAPFRYNDFASFEAALAKLGAPAAIVMEPMRSEEPRENFVAKVAAAARAKGAVFILDEVTSGWRFGFPGAAGRVGVEPDLAVYAKAMSNGFPCAAIVGRKEPMDAADASFISSSYWTDGVGPAAALACVRKMRERDVQGHVWKRGGVLQDGLRQVAARQPELALKIGGMPCAPSLAFQLGDLSAAAKALMIRGMLRRGFLFSSQLYVMFPHDPAMVDGALGALDESLAEVATSHREGRLEAEAGVPRTPQGFARLA